MLEIIINTSDLNKDGIILDIGSTAQASLPESFNTDGPIDIHIRCAKETEVSNSPLVEDYQAGDSYLVSVGNVDDKPTGGTFTVTIGTTTTSALQYNITAADLTTALNYASNVEGFGALTATMLKDGAFQLDWFNFAAVPEITVDATYLRPNCEVSINRFRVGGASQRAQQVFSIKRAAIATATLATPFVAVPPAFTGAQIATESSNHSVFINWNDSYAGSLQAQLTVSGVAANVTLAPTMSLEEIATALSRHPSVSYASTTADNIAVSKIDGAIRVEFIGTLSGESLTSSIVSNTAANPTVITTLAAHGLVVDQTVNIAGNTGSNADINGTRVITSVPSATTFTIAVNCTVSGGTGGKITKQISLSILDDEDSTVLPLGNTGTISYATESLAREFLGTEADELPFMFHVKRLRGVTSTTILATQTTLNRELINGVTLSAPGVIDGLFVRKSELGANVLTALGFAIGTAGAAVTLNGAGGTPSSLVLTNATGLLPAGVVGGAVVGGANSSLTSLNGLTAVPPILRSLSTINLVEHFIGGGNSQVNYGTVGEMGWNDTNIVAQSAGTWTTSTHAHWGVFRMSTGSALGNGECLNLAYGLGFLSGVRIPPLNGITGWKFSYYIALGSTNSIQFECGIMDDTFNGSGKPTNGIYWQFDTNAADANFSAVTRSASVETKTASATAANTSWNVLTIRSDVAGTIIFSINGVDTSISSNVPGVALSPFIRLVTRTAAARSVDIDTVAIQYLIP